MEVNYNLLYYSKSLVQSYLEEFISPQRIGNSNYYSSQYMGEKIWVCFSQPSIEELEVVFKKKETIIYL